MPRGRNGGVGELWLEGLRMRLVLLVDPCVYVILLSLWYRWTGEFCFT